MTQNPRIDSHTQGSKTPSLKPTLAAALASLEVQLDQELARYRRTRDTARLANPPRVISFVGSSPQAIAAAILEQSQTGDIKPNLPSSITPDTPQIEAATEPGTLEDLDHLLLSSAPEVTQPATPATPAPPPPLATTASSIVHTAQATEDESLLDPEGTPTQPDDYLESSEALLRSLTDDEQPKTKKPSSSNEGLLSPLGIGSMLLLLVASLTLGYVVFNPKGLTQFNITKLFNSKSSTPTENPTTVASNSQPQPTPLLTPIAKYPNLAAQEFPEVKDPNDVVGLNPKPQTKPVVPNPAPIQPVAPPVQPPIELSSPPPVNPIAVAPLPKVEPITPTNTPVTPTPSPTSPIQLNEEVKPSADGFYHVVIDNQNERSFASVRDVIPDAYLSSDKKVIFLGAFKTQAEVKQHLELLQKRGIQARVHQP